MTRARYVTPGQTAARVDKLRRLVGALMVGPLSRDAIGSLLAVGPSGVRKYLADLGERVTTARGAEGLTCHLDITHDQARAYLAQLAAAPASRPRGVPKRGKDVPELGAGRHIHLMRDDSHFEVCPHSAPAARDPLVAAFFGIDSDEVRP